MMKKEAKESMRGFAKLTLDFSFKRVFGNGTDNEALISFLNRMIGDVEIKEVRLLPNERLGLIHSDRKVVFDIYCRDKNGTDFIVEMQCARQTFFRDRALYYAAYPLVQQGHRALEEFTELHSRKSEGNKSIQSGFRWDFNLKPIILIGILNFSMDHCEDWPEDKYYSSYMLKEVNSGELENLTDKWMYAFKHMHEFTERPQEFSEKEFDVLFNLSKIANFTESDINLYLDEMIRDNDYWNCIEYAKAEAIAEGLALGRAEGRAEGIRKMSSAGFTSEQIGSILEVSEEEIAAALR